MLNKILKKVSSRVVAKFSYTAMLFFLCLNIFAAEFLFNCSNAAHASSQSSYNLDSKEELLEQFNLGLNKSSHLAAPRSAFFGADGIEHTIGEYRGKFIILYVWATWCTDCINQLTQLEKLANELLYRKINDILIIPLSLDFKSTAYVISYMKQNGITKIPLFLDNKKAIMGELGIFSLPHTSLISKDGVIIASYNQPVDLSEDFIITRLLELAGHEQPKNSVNNPPISAQQSGANLSKEEKQKVIFIG